MINEQVRKLLEDNLFINIATSDSDRRPNVAPKFLLKIDKCHIFLADYVISRTWRNLKENPQVSMSIVDHESLVGFQLNGKAQIVKDKKLYSELMQDLQKRQISQSSKRVVEGLHRGKKHINFEVVFSEKTAFFKIEVNEVVEISPTGELKIDKTCSSN